MSGIEAATEADQLRRELESVQGGSAIKSERLYELAETCAALRQRAERAEAERDAGKIAIDFAKGAIHDAIYSDDGLDGDTGQRVLCILTEWQERGTFDVQPDDERTSVETRLESELEAAQSTIAELTGRAERAEAEFHKTIEAMRHTHAAYLKQVIVELEGFRQVHFPARSTIAQLTERMREAEMTLAFVVAAAGESISVPHDILLKNYDIERTEYLNDDSIVFRVRPAALGEP